MRTIFIAIFEGVEAKNILRTPVLPTLLINPEVRLVLLTKSKERLEFYKKEFQEPRLIYEVVLRKPLKGLDKFFSRLKFFLLRTRTTALKRKMSGGGFFLAFLNWLFARSLVRKVVRFLDYHLVKTDWYREYFEKYQPDLVFLPHLFDEPEIHLLREAKRRKVKTIGFINSWDKVTARCMLRLLPDKVIVFNDLVEQEMIKYNEMCEEDIFVSGQPQYDFYFLSKILSAHVPKPKLIVYAPMGATFSGSDWEMIDLIECLRKEGQFGENVSLLVRFQPNDFIDERELKKRPWLKYDYPGIRFSDSRGVDWDMNFKDLEHLKKTLEQMSLLISHASSLSVDAAIFDKPVININFEIKKLPLSKSPTQFYEMEHYKNALKTGGIRLVSSEAELVQWVNNYLQNPTLHREARKRLDQEQCQFTDGKSGERIGSFILSLLE